jgi:hypothetical protein
VVGCWVRLGWLIRFYENFNKLSYINLQNLPNSQSALKLKMTLSVKKEVEQTWQMPVKLPMLYLRLFNPKSKIWICLHTAIV